MTDKRISKEWKATPSLGATLNEIDTPFVAVDLDAVEKNIDTLMKRFERLTNVSVRPHLKTAKSPQFAKLMLERGAAGICVAKISEAEVFVEAGITDILITTEVAGELKINRLMKLIAQAPDIRIVVDNNEVTEALNEACVANSIKHRLNVLIDLNVGQDRTGVSDASEAIALANHIASMKHLRLIGIQGYEGHLQHLNYEERVRKCKASMEKLVTAADAIRSAGHTIDVVTTGGTGTAEICSTFSGVTEVQPGSFVFMDVAYRKATQGSYRNALTVIATVISRPTATRVVIDAGTKSLSVDMGNAEVVDKPDWLYRPAGDEHGIVEPSAGAYVSGQEMDLVPGDRLTLIPSHIDTTVALHDQFHVMRDGKLIGIWPIATRGKVQ